MGIWPDVEAPEQVGDVGDFDPDLRGADEGSVRAADRAGDRKEEVMHGASRQSVTDVELVFPVAQDAKPLAIADIGGRMPGYRGGDQVSVPVDNEDGTRLGKSVRDLAELLLLRFRRRLVETPFLGLGDDGLEHDVDCHQRAVRQLLDGDRCSRDPGPGSAFGVCEIGPRPQCQPGENCARCQAERKPR